MRKTRKRRKAKQKRINTINKLRIFVGIILTAYVLFSIARDLGIYKWG